MKNNINTASYDEVTSFIFFLAFLRYTIDWDRAKQINIAQAIEERPEYSNRVYKGRQTCSLDVQEKICRFFGSLAVQVAGMSGRDAVYISALKS